MEKPIPFKDPDGHSVAGILANPTAATDRIAILCHGFLSSKDSTTNKAITRTLLDNGVATFRFDFFGHGESEGPFEAITVTTALKQALTALELMTERGYSRLGLMGSSFGGLVALLAAAQHPTLTCLALKCPVVDFPEELNLEFGPDGMSQWKGTDTIPNLSGGSGRIKLAYSFYEDCTRYSGYDVARAITAPTLIVQGEQDELIPLHQSQQFYDFLPVEKALHLLPDADHQFTKGEDFHRMTTLITDWLTAHLGVPSGERGTSRHV